MSDRVIAYGGNAGKITTVGGTESGNVTGRKTAAEAGNTIYAYDAENNRIAKEEEIWNK